MMKRSLLLRRQALAAMAVCAAFSAPSAALAQEPTGAFSAYTADSRKPIDIESDALEVDDKKQIAIFTGNVSATQGDFNLRSKELVVTYASAAKTKTAAAAPAAAAAAAGPLGGSADIKYIEAKGKVFIKSKGDQTATADSALFDVAAQTVTLVGDVVVTQGKNIIKGDRMVIDITTGRTTLLMKDGASEGKGRVRAKFEPKAAEEKPAEDNAAAKPKATPKSGQQPPQ
jgi:lipopolysaccharide export system protein LptA